jgi:hypothetical protein
MLRFYRSPISLIALIYFSKETAQQLFDEMLHTIMSCLKTLLCEFIITGILEDKNLLSYEFVSIYFVVVGMQFIYEVYDHLMRSMSLAPVLAKLFGRTIVKIIFFNVQPVVVVVTVSACVIHKNDCVDVIWFGILRNAHAIFQPVEGYQYTCSLGIADNLHTQLVSFQGAISF